jgi:hypothetical protein
MGKHGGGCGGGKHGGRHGGKRDHYEKRCEEEVIDQGHPDFEDTGFEENNGDNGTPEDGPGPVTGPDDDDEDSGNDYCGWGSSHYSHRSSCEDLFNKCCDDEEVVEEEDDEEEYEYAYC